MHCWNYETFKRIVGKWGNLVSMGENLLGTNNFEKMEMLISISQVKKIDEMVLLEVGDVRFPVSVRELGWSEDLKNYVFKKYRNLMAVDENLSNRRKVILREAKQTWEIGKKLGLRVRGDERDVIEEIMRLEEH
ncbi:hypothetical protein J1N35_002364 [Gossypium stocksii]|uniref:DUF4283 domain-containing protein n=1 Tax=Gossypium stocksii TaxID=47602 RepID=A0A9D3WME8_9ROSI|nr:hypothetical protein J1N35_002364 [Gossypium stocksii]